MIPCLSGLLTILCLADSLALARAPARAGGTRTRVRAPLRARTQVRARGRAREAESKQRAPWLRPTFSLSVSALPLAFGIIQIPNKPDKQELGCSHAGVTNDLGWKLCILQ